MGVGRAANIKVGIRMTSYTWDKREGAYIKRKRKGILPRMIGSAFQATLGLALAMTVLVAYHEYQQAKREAFVQRILTENNGVFVVPPPPPVLGLEG